MANMRPLYEYIGEPIIMFAGSTLSSGGTAASDNTNGVTVGVNQGILILELWGAGDSDFAASTQYQYSSTGLASNAVTSNAGMTCTDLTGSTNNSTDATSAWKVIDIDLEAKSLDAAGKFYVSLAAAETGARHLTVVAIPYGGTRTLPSTMAESVLGNSLS